MSLNGCMVGPDFKAPAAPAVKSYTEKPLPKKTVATPLTTSGGKSQQFIMGQDIPGEWWTLFQSASLNRLIMLGMENSPNLASAMMTLKQSEETLKAQIESTMYPSVNGQLQGERQRFSAATFGATTSPPSEFNLYNATVNVSYTLDVFGANRRQIEALRAQVDYEAFQLQAAYLTLTSNIVTTAITAASLQAQIKATNELVKSHEKQLTIVQRQFLLGGVSKADVLSQVVQLEQTQATLPPLQTQLAQAKYALAVLVGEFPGNSQIPDFNLSSLQLPTKLPVSLSSNLVRQRPDIRASEALLHEASAQVGVATANLFPQITLNGAYGYTANNTNTLFTRQANTWDYTGGLTQPIFNAGALQSQRRAAIDAYKAANAEYQETVLLAFQNVADTLRALENDAKTLRAEKAAEVAAKKSLSLTQSQFQLGGVSYISLLNAEQQYQQSKIATIQAEATRYADTAALFQALGGGWWNRQPNKLEKNNVKNVA
ncbi:MAG: efflux transporter outer membrane subunit [Legionellales bacterium]|nr:efflux transporter outer membrane subunit [Legionellales bacterium]